MSSQSFNPARDIPSLADKVIFITGGTAGLGAGTITELAKHEPAHIFFSGRNQKNADALVEKIRKTAPDVQLTFIKCDVSSLASVQEAAKAIQAHSQRLDVLFLNAGIMAVNAATSVDGYEIQFATNHLGHALLVKLLMPTLQETARSPGADVRIINMTSVAHTQAPKMGIDFATLKSSQNGLGGMIPGGKWSRYGQSKLAQLLYSQELAKHHPEITSVSVHPGIIQTGLFDNMDFMTKLPTMFYKQTPVAEGHYNQCWAATCPKSKLKNGEYYEPNGVVGQRKTKQARDTQLADKLWEWTQSQFEAYA